MKIKLLNSFFVGCSLILGLAIFSLNPKEESSTQESELIAEAQVNNSDHFKSGKSVESFFKSFTNQALNPPPTPELDINNILGSGGYDVEIQGGIKTFLRCTSDLSNNGNFEFFDPNIATYPAGTTYFIDWGDGTTSTQVEDHTYIAGLYTLTYTITFPDGTSDTSEFRVFVGTQPAVITVQLTGNENCLPNQYEFTLTTGNNTPGTTYSIIINDGSTPITLESSDYPIGVPIVETFFHTFLDTSCGITSTINGVPNNNSYSITVRSTNPCSTEGNFTSTGPIRVSEPTEADFILPADIACVNSLVNFEDISEVGTNTGQNGCNGEYGRYWEITPIAGTNIAGGSQLGSDNGNPTDWFSWTDGTQTLGVIFDTPGYYNITLVTRNNCGESRVTKEICIIPEVISEFTLSQDEACFEDNQIVSTNNTSQAVGCDITPIYEWEVTQSNPDCPPTLSPGWAFANGTGPNDKEPEFEFTSPGIYTIRLRVFIEDVLPGADCQDDVFERIITIKDKPKAELEDLIVCQDEPFFINPVVYDCYTSVGTTYAWDFGTTPPASISSSTDPNPQISYDTPGNYTYELTLTNECGSNTYTGNIEVLPPVFVQADGPLEVCSDTTFPLNGTITGGTGNGSWTASIPGGVFTPDANALDPTYTPPAGYIGNITFTLTTDNSGTLCSNASSTHIVNIVTGASADAGNYDPICMDSSILLNGNFGGTATSITWTSSVGGTFVDATDPNTEFTPPAGFTGTLTLTITTDDPAGTCSATSDTVDIQVLPEGEIDPLPDLEFCSTDLTSEISFSSPNISFTTNFDWVIDTNIGLAPLSGTGNIPSFVTENLTINPIVATVTVTPIIGSGKTMCSGPPETFTITVNPTPIISDMTLELCDGDNFDVIPANTGGNFIPTGTNYTWENPISNPTGAIIGGTAENIPQPSISQPIENTTTDAASITYLVTPVLGGCEGIPFNVTVNFAPEPVIQDINLEVCSGEAFSVVPDENFSGNSIPTGTTYSWGVPTIVPAGSILGSAAQNTPVSSIDQQLENITNALATVTYTIIPDLNGCEGEPFTITVEVKPSPSIQDVGLTICSEETFTIIPDNSTPDIVPSGTTYTWGLPTVSVPGSITGMSDATSAETEITQTLTNTTNENVSVTYTVTPEADGCLGDPFLIEVIVEPKPFIEPITESICTGGTFSITPANTGASIVPVNTTYTWAEPISNPAGAITGGSAETTPQTEISQNVVNTSENLATLTYTVTPQTGSCIGEPFSIEITVESSGLIEDQPAAFQTICEGGQISPLGVGLASGESSTTTYQWFTNTTATNAGGTAIPGATDATYLPPAFNLPGTYYFYVIVSPQGNECGDVVSQVSEVEVFEDPTFDVQNLDDQDLCLDAQASEWSVEVSGGLGAINYQWYVNTTADTTTGTAIAGENSPEFTPPTSDVGILYYYVVISQSASGCENTSDLARVRIEPQPFINQHPQSQELCIESTPNLLSVNINFSLGSPFYQWFENDEESNVGGTPIAGANQPTFLPPTDVAGEQFYYVVVSFDNSSCGPVVSDPATLNVVPFAELNPINDFEVCNGDEIAGINFSTTNPIMINTFEWTNDNPAIGLAASGLGNIPTFTATNTTGITQTAVITVTSESVFIGDPCGLSTTQFTITVPAEVEDNAIISDFNGNQTSCSDANDGSIQITPSGGIPISGNQSYLFNWTGPDGFSSNQEDIFNLRQGDYDLEITDGFGCVYEFSYEIDAPDELLVLEDAVLNIQCHGEFTGRILISATGGTGSYSYNWLKDGMFVATTQDLENIGAGYYTVIVTDENSCIATEDFEVTEPTPIEIEIVEKTAIVCNDEFEIPDAFSPQNLADEFNGFINIEVQGGTPLQTGPTEFTYQYEWLNEIEDIISTEKNLTGVGPGLYTINVYDNLSCVASKEVELIMPEPIDIAAESEDETCAFNEDGSIELDITGGTEPYNIVWNTGETGAILNNLAPGTYTATITDKYNCNEEVSVEIEGVNALEIDHNAESISCFNAADGFIDVNANGGRQFTNGSYEYQWSGPEGFTSTEASISNLSIGGTYSLVVTDASNCSEVLDVFINEPAPLEVSFQTTQANCFGIDDGTITLFVDGGTPPYTSNFGPGDSTFLFENLEPGIYDIEVMDDNGCIELLEIEIEPDFINEIDPPQGEPFQEFCIEDQPMLSDLNVQGLGVKWYLSPTSDDALPDDYLITETTILYARNFDESLNCLSSQTLRVEVSIIEGILEVNNFITVNGNNLNERLNVVNIELFPENEMKIYNRYGKLVWETTGYNNTDNAFKGESNVGGTLNQANFLPTGTYFYILNYKSPCRNDTKKGFVQVDNNNR